MIKASAGGGGKGMRIAWNDEETRYCAPLPLPHSEFFINKTIQSLLKVEFLRGSVTIRNEGLPAPLKRSFSLPRSIINPLQQPKVLKWKFYEMLWKLFKHFFLCCWFSMEQSDNEPPSHIQLFCLSVEKDVLVFETLSLQCWRMYFNVLFFFFYYYFLFYLRTRQSNVLNRYGNIHHKCQIYFLLADSASKKIFFLLFFHIIKICMSLFSGKVSGSHLRKQHPVLEMTGYLLRSTLTTPDTLRYRYNTLEVAQLRQ